MATYQISLATSQDLIQIANMNAEFTTLDPFANCMLRDSSGVSDSLWESRRNLAFHNYDTGLAVPMRQGEDFFVLKAWSVQTPLIIEASASVKYFPPHPDVYITGKDEPGVLDIPPDCVNAP